MHTLVEDVLPYLVVFYLVDSLVLVRASEWALLAPWGRFRMERSGLHLVGCSPFAQAAGLFVPPLLLSPNGVVLFDPAAAAPSEATLLPFDGLGTLAVDGKTLVLGGRRIATPGPAAARKLRATVKGLRDAPPGERPARLRDLGDARRADLDRARSRCAATRGPSRWLRGLGLAQLVATFGLLPASVAFEGAPGPETVLLLLLALHVLIVALSWRMLRRCGVSSGDATSALAPMLLFPPAAIHAGTHLSRDLFLDLDPLAAAGAILDAEAFRPLARRLVHRLELLRGLGPDAAGAAETQLGSWRAVIAATGSSLEQVLEAPASADPSAALYCPLCAGEYRAGFTACSDCGIPLRSLAGPVGSRRVLLEA